MNIFNFLSKKIQVKYSNQRAARERILILNAFRAKNPTCTIEDCALEDVIMDRQVRISSGASLHNACLGKYVTVLHGVSLHNVDIGDFSYISFHSRLINTHVGKFCSIGPHIQIGLAPHPSRIFVSTYPAFYSNSNSGCAFPLRYDKIFDDSVPETKLGHDIWIGTHVIISGGISIGTGAIIAAGAVVVKDVPPYAVVGGNPATIIKYRFSESEIDSLLTSEWWNWPVDKIKSNVNGFSNIDTFLKILNK
jgi:acetyltransferase-like isoleucine patch superfamily enzyme